MQMWFEVFLQTPKTKVPEVFRHRPPREDHIQGVTCTAFHPTNPTLFSGSLDKAGSGAPSGGAGV